MLKLNEVLPPEFIGFGAFLIAAAAIATIIATMDIFALKDYWISGPGLIAILLFSLLIKTARKAGNPLKWILAGLIIVCAAWLVFIAYEFTHFF